MQPAMRDASHGGTPARLYAELKPQIAGVRRYLPGPNQRDGPAHKHQEPAQLKPGSGHAKLQGKCVPTDAQGHLGSTRDADHRVRAECQGTPFLETLQRHRRVLSMSCGANLEATHHGQREDQRREDVVDFYVFHGNFEGTTRTGGNRSIRTAPREGYSLAARLASPVRRVESRSETEPAKGGIRYVGRSLIPPGTNPEGTPAGESAAHFAQLSFVARSDSQPFRAKRMAILFKPA